MQDYQGPGSQKKKEDFIFLILSPSKINMEDERSRQEMKLNVVGQHLGEKNITT